MSRCCQSILAGALAIAVARFEGIAMDTGPFDGWSVMSDILIIFRSSSRWNCGGVVCLLVSVLQAGG